MVSEAFWASLLDVTDRIVRGKFCACGKAGRMVESVAWEENLSDSGLIGEESLASVRVDPLVEPLLRGFAGQTDTVFLGDQENMPHCESRYLVAWLLKTFVEHLEPDLPCVRVIFLQLDYVLLSFAILACEKYLEVREWEKDPAGDLKLMDGSQLALPFDEFAIDPRGVNPVSPSLREPGHAC